MFMHSDEYVIVKAIQPNRRKAEWLEAMASACGQAVALGLEAAHASHSASRGRLHDAVYATARSRLGLPAEYVRMSVNAAVALARSYYGKRKARQHVSFPKLNGTQGIGLGVHAYAIVQAGERFALRLSTGKRGQYIWLPLSVPPRYRRAMPRVHGDGKLFKRRGQWYAILPVPNSPPPTGCSGEPTFIGVDLGVVRHAAVAAPDRVLFFNGKPARRRREHFADLRRRYQRHQRLDRVREGQGKESRWAKDINHKISRRVVELALHYHNPVLVLERLDGIRRRTKGSKRFNRMMASWPFRDLADKIEYKAEQLGIKVVYVDPRRTSRTCPKCGHASRSNRPQQGLFRCVACGYQANADLVAAHNIAAAGPAALAQGLSDPARPDKGQTGEMTSRPDGVKGCARAHPDPNLEGSTLEPHRL